MPVWSSAMIMCCFPTPSSRMTSGAFIGPQRAVQLRGVQGWFVDVDAHGHYLFAAMVAGSVGSRRRRAGQ